MCSHGLFHDYCLIVFVMSALQLKIALPVALAVVTALAFSFNNADAIVSGQPVELHYKQYPYNLLVPFFTIVCSMLLITLVVHYYRTQWGQRSIITKWYLLLYCLSFLDQSTLRDMMLFRSWLVKHFCFIISVSLRENSISVSSSNFWVCLRLGLYDVLVDCWFSIT